MRLTRCLYGLAFVAIACGGSDEDGLFGGSGGSSGSATGGSGGSTAGASGATTGGTTGSGGASTGGVGGASTGGAGGASTGGVGGASTGGSGGDAGAGAKGGSGGTATGGSGGDAGGGATGGNGGSSGWCTGNCGTNNPIPPTGCYCDDACTDAGDCCPDYGPACNEAAGAGAIKCGSVKCTVGTQFCCQQFASGVLDPQCQQPNTTCIGPDIECDGPEDCGSGEVCCSVPQGGNNNVNFECRQASNCTDSSYRIVCGNDWTVCQSGQKCVPHPWVPQYNYCSGS